MKRALTRLSENRRALDHHPRARSLSSPVLLAIQRELVPRIRRLATGRFLDVGSGMMPFRGEAIAGAEVYESLDLEARTEDLTYLADVQNLPIAGLQYDTVLCSEVLEHLPRPEAALAEIFRVLRPNGHLLLTVPFLSRLHEEPSDYFRYTEHGLREMLARQGFEVEEITPIASVFTFLGHQLSSVIILGTWRIPVLREIAFAVNLIAIVLPCYWLDRLLMPKRKLPAGYVAVARKPVPPPASDEAGVR